MVDILLVNGSIQTQDKTGITLYTFANDLLGQSLCTADCIATWPPLLADASTQAVAPFAIIQRADGNRQWSLRNKPLYFYAGDSKPGDVKGEGIGGLWHAALYEPVRSVSAAINANDGDYLTAAGSVLVGVPTTGSAAFIAERRDREGFSLYTFTQDTFNASQCHDTCLVNWPPLLADNDDKAEAPYSIISRAMGGTTTARQWAYHGQPLYFFLGDMAAGQTNGKVIANWRLARPLPVQTTSNPQLGSLLAAAGWVKQAVSLSGVEQTSSLAKHGFTLYTFDSDTDLSHCSGDCLSAWPALIAGAGAVAISPFSLVARASGELQWALQGMPLYFYSGDTLAGEAKGDDMGGVWHVARVAPVALDNNPDKGVLFVAHGNIINASGSRDNAHQHFTLYTFAADPPGSSTCFGACLTMWPALYAPVDANAFGDFTVLTRDATSKQWAYKNKPLYFYAGDTSPGQTLGDYPSWTIARP